MNLITRSPVAPRSLRRAWLVSGSDLHLLQWLRCFAAPLGTTVRRVSVVVARCARRGLIDRRGTHVRLTTLGRAAILCECLWRESRRQFAARSAS